MHGPVVQYKVRNQRLSIHHVQDFPSCFLSVGQMLGA